MPKKKGKPSASVKNQRENESLTKDQSARVKYLDDLVRSTGEGAILVDNTFSATLPPIPHGGGESSAVCNIACFEPPEGWDAWCTNMTLEGVPHSYLHTLAAMITNFKLVPNQGDTETCDYINALFDALNAKEVWRTVEFERQAYGRALVYPYFTKKGKGDLIKLKNIDPTRVKIIRDNEKDLEAIYDLEEAQEIFDAEAARGKPIEANNTGRIVGFLFDLITDEEAAAINKQRKERLQRKKNNDRPGEPIGGSDVIPYEVPDFFEKPVLNDDTDVIPKKVFFNDDELIVFFRFPSGIFPNGVSMLRSEYTLLVNKLYMEWAAVAAFAKVVAPTYIVKVPRVFKNLKEEVREELQKVKAEPGSDLIVDFHPDLSIAASDVMLGIGRNAVDILNYIKQEWTIGSGMFDAMFSASSANRSTAEVQSDLFMRKIESFRNDLEFTITRRLLKRIMDNAHGISEESEIEYEPDGTPKYEPLVNFPYNPKKGPYTLPSFRWGALVEKDKIGFLSAYVPFTMHMDREQIDYVLEEYGDLPKRAEEPVGVLGQFNPYQPYQAGQEGFAGGRPGKNPQSVEQKTAAGGGVPPKSTGVKKPAKKNAPK